MIIKERVPAVNSLYDITKIIEEQENCVRFYDTHGMKERADGIRGIIKAFKLMRRANRKKGIFSKNEQKSYGKSTNFVELYMQVSKKK